MERRPKRRAPSPEGSAAAAPRAAGRPRSEESRRAVLDAAYAILVEAGLGAFSVEAVALRSGVARTTIYRWWPSKGLLAIESFLDAFRPQLTYVETGVAAADFTVLLRSLARALGGPAGRVAASVLAQAQREPAIRQTFLEAFSEPLRRESARLLHRGIERGEFRADLDVPRVLDAAVGAIYLRLLFGQPLDANWSSALSDTVLRGCVADSAVAEPGVAGSALEGQRARKAGQPASDARGGRARRTRSPQPSDRTPPRMKAGTMPARSTTAPPPSEPAARAI